MKKECLSEFSTRGNLPKNLFISGVPSIEKQGEFLRMTKISNYAEFDVYTLI
ncbi:MAG: hypothetical protein HQ534_10595 [Armatimonadetes bacterium]|nr:hypothetical protein [Armatimonadota bacterium]